VFHPSIVWPCFGALRAFFESVNFERLVRNQPLGGGRRLRRRGLRPRAGRSLAETVPREFRRIVPRRRSETRQKRSMTHSGELFNSSGMGYAIALSNAFPV
jgi:hypothetical protein